MTYVLSVPSRALAVESQLPPPTARASALELQRVLRGVLLAANAGAGRGGASVLVVLVKLRLGKLTARLPLAIFAAKSVCHDDYLPIVAICLQLLGRE